MKLLKQKTFKKHLLINQLLTLILLIGLTGCNFLKKKEIYIINNNYCDLYSPLTLDKQSKQDITIIRQSFFEYVKINEITYTCECLAKTAKEQCYKDFEKQYK